MILCYHCMNQIEDENASNCAYCGKLLHEELPSGKYLKPGTVLRNKFIVGYPLGAGGFGNTYIGWNKLLLRKVAIKEFYPEQYITRKDDGVTVTVGSEDLQPRFRKGLQQFLEEARSVAALQDIKGVVEISNFFEENGTGYIIMEYLEGMDVKTILKKSGNRKDYEWCRRVILTVLHTLRDIHKRGVLHRDIAPDNIFVTNEGVIKLIDFGAAKHASALANMKADVVLKVGYAPIEQYSKNSKQGPYTDLYAVAALFYRMLTGQKPIPANERLANDTLITPSQMGVELPEQAELAIMVCLNVRPEYRLQSAEEFMEALEGKNFIPVYEPEWILPAVEEKKGWQALPLSAKISIWVASIVLVLGMVGSFTFIRSRDNKGDLAGSDIVIGDYSNKPIEEAKEAIDSLNKTLKEKNVDCQLVIVEEARYDSDTNKVNTVFNQSIPSGTNLASGHTGEQEIILSYYQDETITYGELSHYNAFELAEKMDTDLTDERFVAAEDISGNDGLFGISKIGLTDESEITKEDICNEASADKTIKIEEIKSIRYSNLYCFLENVTEEAYLGKRIKDVTVDTYRKTNENAQNKDTKPLSEVTVLFDDSYYSFIYGEGIICGVEMSQVDKNGIVDTSTGAGIGETKLFKVVGKGKSFDINSFSTGAALRDALVAAGISGDNISITGTGEGDELIDVTVEKGTRECFAGDAIITIQTKKKVVVVPSTQSSGGTATGGGGARTIEVDHDGESNQYFYIPE